MQSGRPWRPLCRSLPRLDLQDRGRLDLALDDQDLDRVHLRDERLRDLRADLAHALATVLEREHEIASALELAGVDEREELEGRDVDLLRAARQDVPAEVGLVGVDADSPYGSLALVVRLRRVERSETATAGDLED